MLARDADPDNDWDAFLDSIAQADCDAPGFSPRSTSRTSAQPEYTTRLDIDANTTPSSDTTELVATSSAAESSCNQIARKRQIQKNFRVRVKERNESMRILLAQTQQQLRQSETERISLLSQNQLLTRLLQQGGPSIGLQLPGQSSTAQDATTLDYAPKVVQDLLLPAIRLMSWTGGQHFMTPHDIASLPLARFGSLYTATTEQMEAMLTATGIDSSDHNRQQQLYARVLDATRLRFALFAVKPGEILCLGRASMDGSYPAKPRIPSQVVQGLASFSEIQLQDILALRHLFLEELGRLSRARRALVQQVTKCGHLHRLKALAGQLQQNVDDEHSAYLKMLTASCFGN